MWIHKIEKPYFIVKVTFMMCIFHNILDGSSAAQGLRCVIEFSVSHKKRVKTNHQLYNINKTILDGVNWLFNVTLLNLAWLQIQEV